MEIQNPMGGQMSGSKGKKGWLIAVVIIAILAAAAAWWWQKAPSESQSPESVLQESDTTGAITESLESIDLGDLEQDFQSINQDLNSL